MIITLKSYYETNLINTKQNLYHVGDEFANYRFSKGHTFGSRHYWEFKKKFELRFLSNVELNKKTSLLEPQQATEEQLASLHTQYYIYRVKILPENARVTYNTSNLKDTWNDVIENLI